MKNVCLAVAASAFAALIAVSTPALAGAQQEKMKTCNATAKEKALKGAERKQFMKECLSAKHPDQKSAQSAQRDRMTACNKDAGTKGLKGDERKQFMSECLKGK